MTWSLVEALTGIRTNDDYDSHERGFDRVVTIKTHYPVKDARHGFGKLDEALNGRPGGNGGREHHVKAGRAIVIVRNPVNAIPSYFNLQYGEYIMLYCITLYMLIRWVIVVVVVA